jgi:transcriptional regulator with XRE-family HTH domain
MQDIFDSFGKSVRQKRLALNMTQVELADRLGMCNRTIVQLENGKGNTKFETLILVARELDISIDASVFRDRTANNIPKCVSDYFAGKSESESQKYIDLCKQADQLKN